MKRVSIATVLLVLLFSISPVFAANTAIDEVRDVMKEVVDVVEAHPEDAQKATRHTKLREVIAPRFDFREMSKRSLGAHWTRVDETKREEFVDLFSELLARTYLSRIDNVKRDMVEVIGQKVKEPKALVRTKVTYKGETFPIDYKMLNTNGNWKVYDVVVENIGLVANYRTEFSGVIRKEKFDGLLERLRRKNSKAEKAAS